MEGPLRLEENLVRALASDGASDIVGVDTDDDVREARRHCRRTGSKDYNMGRKDYNHR
jgi:hypothetical protein